MKKKIFCLVFTLRSLKHFLMLSTSTLHNLIFNNFIIEHFKGATCRRTKCSPLHHARRKIRERERERERNPSHLTFHHSTMRLQNLIKKSHSNKTLSMRRCREGKSCQVIYQFESFRLVSPNCIGNILIARPREKCLARR